MKNGQFVAQLDIDSNTIAAMDYTDQRILEEICAMLSDLF
jgi:putative methionine-R-sulfoxide reductase with GAF domain